MGLPVRVIGGYLGSGKTTWINRLLASETSECVGVLVNDFGEIAIDAALIRNQRGRTLALANGCVCCSIANDLDGALEQLAAMQPALDRVVLETSGVARPRRIADRVQAFPGYALEQVWVLADAADVRRLAKDKFVGPLVVQQLREADRVRLTKLDLVEDPVPVRAWVDAHTGGVPIDVDVKFETRSLQKESLSEAELEAWLSRLPARARVKGVIRRGGESWVFQRIRQQTTFEPAAPTACGKSELVAIWPVVESASEEEP